MKLADAWKHMKANHIQPTSVGWMWTKIHAGSNFQTEWLQSFSNCKYWSTDGT